MRCAGAEWWEWGLRPGLVPASCHTESLGADWNLWGDRQEAGALRITLLNGGGVGHVSLGNPSPVIQ